MVVLKEYSNLTYRNRGRPHCGTSYPIIKDFVVQI